MRRAFSLTEVMLAVFIFTVLAAAMLGVFNAASRLYQQGQRSVAAADEATAILQLLRRDAERAVGAESGGQFYSWIAPDGSCVVGWSLRPDAYERPELEKMLAETSPRLFQAFVFWWRDDDDHLYRLLLPWPIDLSRSDDALAQALIDPDPETDPRPALTTALPLDGAGEPLAISRDCLHFGAWLSGIELDDQGSITVGLIPATTRELGFDDPPRHVWQWLSNGDALLPADPWPESAFARYSTIGSPRRMPDSVRFDLILSGNDAAGAGRLIRDLASNDEHLAVRGLQGFIPSQGSLVRVGDDPASREWIGVYTLESDGFRINTDPRHGPVAIPEPALADGRGALRSIPVDHPIGSLVHTGKRFTLTHRFGR